MIAWTAHVRSPRKWFFVLAALSVILAVATVFIMAAGDQLVYMVMFDATSTLRNRGTISDAQFQELANDIALYARPAFAGQRYIPAGLFVTLAVVQLLAGLLCPRTIAHGTGGTSADAGA